MVNITFYNASFGQNWTFKSKHFIQIHFNLAVYVNRKLKICGAEIKNQSCQLDIQEIVKPFIQIFKKHIFNLKKTKLK